MTTVVIVVHLLLAIAMIFLILIQQSEGGGLGIGGGGGGMGGFMTGRATANLLTRSTAFIAAAFFVTSLTLAIMGDQGRQRGSILDRSAEPANQTQAPALPALPMVPNAPSK